jgi:hypothetical protein
MNRDAVRSEITVALDDVTIGQDRDPLGTGARSERLQQRPGVGLRAADSPGEQGEETETEVQTEQGT